MWKFWWNVVLKYVFFNEIFWETLGWLLGIQCESSQYQLNLNCDLVNMRYLIICSTVYVQLEHICLTNNVPTSAQILTFFLTLLIVAKFCLWEWKGNLTFLCRRREKMSQNQGNNFQVCVSHFSTVISRLIWQENGTFLRGVFSSHFLPTVRKVPLSLQKYKIKFLFLQNKKKLPNLFFLEKTKILNHSFSFGWNFLFSLLSHRHTNNIVLLITTHSHIPFTHAFYASCCVFLVGSWTNQRRYKENTMQCGNSAF